MADLERQLYRPNASAFFRGARVSVETGNRFLKEAERRQLETLLAAHNIHLGATMPAVAHTDRLHPERSEMITAKTARMKP